MNESLNEMLVLSEVVGGTLPRARLEDALIGEILLHMAELPGKTFGHHYDIVVEAMGRENVVTAHDRYGRFSGFALLGPSNQECVIELHHIQATFGASGDLIARARTAFGLPSKLVRFTRLKNGLSRQRERPLRQHPKHDRGAEFFRSQFEWLQSWDARGLLHAATLSLKKALELRDILGLMRREARYASLPLREVVNRITNAQLLRQCKIYKEISGEVSGFVSWAWLDQKHIESLRSRRPGEWHLFEWNDGDRMILVDNILGSAHTQQVSSDIPFGEFASGILTEDEFSDCPLGSQSRWSILSLQKANNSMPSQNGN